MCQIQMCLRIKTIFQSKNNRVYWYLTEIEDGCIVREDIKVLDGVSLNSGQVDHLSIHFR